LNTNQWDAACVAEYELLDNIITTSMLMAEHELSKRVTTTYQWSPVLKKAAQGLRYWTLRLRQSSNKPVSVNRLERFRQEGSIPNDEHSLYRKKDIKAAQTNAYQNLKALQAQHHQLRDNTLEELAEAIILDRSPHLEDERQAHILAERTSKQVKQLISR